MELGVVVYIFNLAFGRLGEAHLCEPVCFSEWVPGQLVLHLWDLVYKRKKKVVVVHAYNFRIWEVDSGRRWDQKFISVSLGGEVERKT